MRLRISGLRTMAHPRETLVLNRPPCKENLTECNVLHTVAETMKVLFAAAVTALAASGCTGASPQPGAQPGHEPGEVFRDCATCPEMVVVPSGTVLLGTPMPQVPPGVGRGEETQRRAVIDAAFAVGVYEVTFAEWDACVEAGGCGGYSPGDQGWGRGTRPVINVNFRDARAYVRWLSGKTGHEYRLPTDAEWEYVARAGTRTLRFWGDEETEQCRHANGYDTTGYAAKPHPFSPPVGCEDGYAWTAPVGSFVPNPFGLHDVLGNVKEWNNDCWRHPVKPANIIDLLGWFCITGRVTRGGHWGAFPGTLRSAWRGAPSGGTRNSAIGFRVVRTLEPTS